jgi:hypothetical protein
MSPIEYKFRADGLLKLKTGRLKFDSQAKILGLNSYTRPKLSLRSEGRSTEPLPTAVGRGRQTLG